MTPRVLVALASALLIAGCTPAANPTPSKTPVPSPTFQCTPEAGGTPAPCDQRAHETMLAKDALYAEAAQLIPKFIAADAAQRADIRRATVTPDLKALVTDDFAETLTTYYEIWLNDDVSLPQAPVVSVPQRLPGLTKEGSAVAMRVCVDWSGSSTYKGGKAVAPGPRLMSDFFLVGSVKELRISQRTEVVDGSC